MTVGFYHQPADCASVRFNAAWLNLKNTSNCLEGEKLNGYFTTQQVLQLCKCT